MSLDADVLKKTLGKGSDFCSRRSLRHGFFTLLSRMFYSEGDLRASLKTLFSRSGVVENNLKMLIGHLPAALFRWVSPRHFIASGVFRGALKKDRIKR